MKDNRFLFDWFSFSTKIHSPELIIKEMGLDIQDFELMHGHHGYRQSYRSNGISVNFDGGREDVDMGVWVDMGGKGCRWFEGHSNLGFHGLSSLILSAPNSMKMTRCDVAFDDFTGVLDMEQVFQQTLVKNWRSRWENYDVHASNTGYSVEFGSNSSDIMLTIYDKKAEQEGKGYPVDCDHWVRAELQFRRKLAQNLIELLTEDNIGNIYYGVISNYFNFVIPSETDTNKARWPVAVWWLSFLENTQKIKIFSVDTLVYTYQNLFNCVSQLRGALRTLVHVAGLDSLKDIIYGISVRSLNRKYVELIGNMGRYGGKRLLRLKTVQYRTTFKLSLNG